MEPRSFNRGDSFVRGHVGQVLSVASMEPRSFNRGDMSELTTLSSSAQLQWSHGRLTVVTRATGIDRLSIDLASMEPRSFNRGDTTAGLTPWRPPRSFNGATVV